MNIKPISSKMARARKSKSGSQQERCNALGNGERESAAWEAWEKPSGQRHGQAIGLDAPQMRVIEPRQFSDDDIQGSDEPQRC